MYVCNNSLSNSAVYSLYGSLEAAGNAALYSHHSIIVTTFQNVFNRPVDMCVFVEYINPVHYECMQCL